MLSTKEQVSVSEDEKPNKFCKSLVVVSLDPTPAQVPAQHRVLFLALETETPARKTCGVIAFDPWSRRDLSQVSPGS